MNILYFAYGSNMLMSRLLARISPIKKVGNAKAIGWRVVFNKRSKDGSGKANLILAPEHETPGVLYEIDKLVLDKLDKFEKGYDRTSIEVYSESEKPINTITYISRITIDPPVALDAYKQLVITGARENNLSEDYIQYLQQLPSRPE